MVKGYCHYHLCERKGEVEQCPHCKKHFCSEHINPIEPGSYHPEKSRVFVNQIRLGHEKTHPCPDYVDYLEQQKKIQGASWGRALDRLTGRTHKIDELEEYESAVYQGKVSAEYKKQQKIDEKARLRAEKEKLAQEIEEKQRRHLKEQEKDEPYLYRYIPPEEKSKHPPKVPEKYQREQVVFEREGYIKSFFNKIRKYLQNKYHKFKFWLRNRPHRAYNNWHAFFLNVIWIIALSITFLIIYSNINKLNKIVIWFLPLGGSLVIINLIFWIKYVVKLFKRGYYWFHGERNGVRYAIILILLLILWWAYQNRDTVFNPVINFYDKIDFSVILPIGISKSIPEESIFSSKSVNNIKEKTSEIFQTNPERETDCKQAFEYLNNVRLQYNKKKIEWDSRAYNLAVFRSRDMYERNYFDHVTPEGKCDKDFQADYDFKSYEVIAENIGGMTYYSTGEVSGDCKEAVDGWLTSRGHRYNLLYDEHISGAIGCYKHICVFLGVHTNPYGLGAGPCSTGDEGLAYWQSVGKQEGEV